MDITQQQIQSMIDAAINQRQQFNQINLSPIANHAHSSGGDGGQIDPNDLLNASVYFQVRQVTLISSQILGLHSTPVAIIPAIGSANTSVNLNTVVIVEGITAKNYFGGTAYAGANALEFRYTDGAGTKVSADIPAAFINATDNRFAHVSGVATAFTPVYNTPIVVTVPTANPTLGNGNIIISVKYRVISL